MRAQLRMTTLGESAEPPPGDSDTSGDQRPVRRAVPGPRSRAARRRRARVRTRLLVAVLLTGAAVLAAGIPSVQAALSQLDRSQRELADARLGLRAVHLSQTLADERDALVIAAVGGQGAPGAELTDEDRALADQRTAELADDAPPAVRERLDGLGHARERALNGEATAAETYAAYTGAIRALGGLIRGGFPVGPVPELASAADASAAARALLVAALSGGGPQPELTGLALREAAREDTALDSFAATASRAEREAYASAVRGPAVEEAEEYLRQLTAAPELTAQAQELPERPVAEALTARTEQQRGVLMTLAAERTQAVDDAHQGDLVSLCLRTALVLAALLLALGVSVRTARSLTRPLAAIRLGSRRVAADPERQQPVKYTGRNDEFAEVVASVNALHARAVELHRQASETAKSTGGLRAERDRLLAEQRELTNRMTALHGAVHGMFARHAQRLLALTAEQLAVIEDLEKNETDPDHLSVLFTLDHLAARMRRHGENLLLLAGAGPAGRPGNRTPLIDVLRAAVSEIEHYELVEIAPPPPAVDVIGPAARDVSHLLAELLDNAAQFSPDGARVRLTGRWLGEELAVTVADEGADLPPARLAELNARLADPVTPPASDQDSGSGMGLYTVARLAARHGLRCWLAPRPGGGTLAEVALPATLLRHPEPEPPVTATPAQGVPLPEDTGAHRAPPPEHARADEEPSETERTSSGLPLRARRPVPAPAPEPGPAPTPAGGVSAEELRRRLGGFQRGAREGHRAAGEETPS